MSNRVPKKNTEFFANVNPPCFFFVTCFMVVKIFSAQKYPLTKNYSLKEKRFPTIENTLLPIIYISILARKKRRLSCRQFKNLPLFLNFNTYNYVIIIFQPHHQKILHVKRYSFYDILCFENSNYRNLKCPPGVSGGM